MLDRSPKVLARLRADLATPHGIYCRGLVVRVLGRNEGGLKICLDPHSWHLGKCHTATVRSDLLDRTPLKRRPSSRHPRGLVA